MTSFCDGAASMRPCTARNLNDKNKLESNIIREKAALIAAPPFRINL